MSPALCDVDGCTRYAVKRQWCDMHYRRWLRKGRLGEPQPARLPAHSPCSVNGCDEPNEGRGLCHKHYQRWWAGTPSGIKSRPSSNLGTIQRPFSLDAMGETARPWLFYLTEWLDPTADEVLDGTTDDALLWDLLAEEAS